MAFASGTLARHLGGVRAFRHDPIRPCLQSGFARNSERATPSTGATDQAVRLLHRTGSFVAETVAGTFHDIDARNSREAPQLVHAQDERPVHHAVHEISRWRRGSDIRDTGMMALKMKRGGGRVMIPVESCRGVPEEVPCGDGVRTVFSKRERSP